MDEEHIPDDVLEAYALGVADDAGLDALETHLFFCRQCLARLEEVDAFIRAARKALERKPN